MKSYGFADGHGHQITRGLQLTPEQARERAQQWADERADSVDYWEEGSPETSISVLPRIKKITITLTDHAPVTVLEKDWPVVASAACKLACPACVAHGGRVEVLVRRHADGRAIVYAVDGDKCGGFLVGFDGSNYPDNPERWIPHVIRMAAMAVGCFQVQVVEDCVAKLPPVELS